MTSGGEVVGLEEIAERLKWRDNVLMPHEPMMPAHAYVAQRWDDTDLEAWDAIALLVAHHPESYDAFFRALQRPIRYLETDRRRYWETNHGGGRFLNRCGLDSVEPPRRVDQGAKPIPLRDWGASLPWWPRYSGYGEWRKVNGKYVFERWEGPNRPPATCPACGSPEVVPIVFGFPGPELIERSERGEVALGGCCITDNDPDTHCKACGHEWAAT